MRPINTNTLSWSSFLNKQHLPHWITRIYQTEDIELDCCGVQAALPAYVDNNQLDSLAAAIQAHLRQCPNCQESYDGLRLVVLAEANGELIPAGALLASFELRPTESSLLSL